MSGIRRSCVLGLGVALTAGLAASGCEEARHAFGLSKNSPDEFAIVTRAPLVVPPDFSLRPPAPGEARPQDVPIQRQARDVLVGNSRPAPSAPVGSGGEAALLRQAGAGAADTAIRAQVDLESAALAESGKSFIDKLLFWEDAKLPGTVVDPVKESQRIRENVALGEPVNKGGAPVIQRRERGWFGRLFD